MEPTQRQLENRDRKETSLDVVNAQIATNEFVKIRYQAELKKQLNAYYAWLRENNIPGRKYPLPPTP